MSVVTYFVETAGNYLDSAAETQFGSVAATVGTLIVISSTLLVILVFINMAFQYRSMDGCAFRAHPPGDSDLIRPPVPI